MSLLAPQPPQLGETGFRVIVNRALDIKPINHAADLDRPAGGQHS